MNRIGRRTRARRVRPSEPSAGEGAPMLPDVLQFMRLIWALDHDLQRTSKRMLRGLGVTGPQRLALRLIGEVPGISPGELAALLHVHPSTLTGVLARLVEGRLVVRDTHADDARRSVLRLSRRGARVDAVRAGTVEEAIETVLRRTSRADRQCVARVLRQLTEALTSGGTAPHASVPERRHARARPARMSRFRPS